MRFNPPLPCGCYHSYEVCTTNLVILGFTVLIIGIFVGLFIGVHTL